MTDTDLAVMDTRQPIAMKSRLVHWVRPETAAKIQLLLEQQQSHRFMLIEELAITINTAEIEGVYTREQYDDLARTKAGQWQCPYRRWHEKKDHCQCRREIEIRHQQQKREREQADLYREPTDTERKENVNRMAKMRKNLEDRGILSKKMSV